MKLWASCGTKANTFLVHQGAVNLSSDKAQLTVLFDLSAYYASTILTN